MKIHSIEFQGIGPFPDKHQIDLDLLGDSALVLIEGPTGAGKSTLLDAISFAFFGAVEKDGSKERIRSHHAKDSDESYVRVKFSTQAGTFEVERVAERFVQKTRGKSGFKKEAGKCVLKQEVIAGRTEVIEHQASEAGKRITELLGMTREQFEQIVLLPQGEFETFLMSSTKERKPLLEKIFNTHLYSRLKEKIHEMAQAWGQELERKNESVVQAASALLPVFSLDRESIEQIKSDLKSPQAEILAMQKIKGHSKALKAIEKSRAAEHAALKDKLQILQGEVEKRRIEKDASNLVSALENKLEDATAMRDATLGSWPPGAEDWLSEKNIGVQKGTLDFKKALGLLTSEIGVAEQLKGAAEALIELRHNRQLSGQNLSAVQKTLEEIKPEIEERLPRGISEIESELKGIKVTEDSADLLKAKLEGIEEQLNVAHQIGLLEERSREAILAADSANALVLNSRRALAELEARRFSQLAFELSLDLEDGEPCQVCGSIDHPKKAKKPKGALDRVEIESSRQALLQLEANFAKANQESIELLAELKATRSRIKRPLNELESEKNSLSEEVIATDNKLTRKSQLGEKLDALRSELDALKDKSKVLELEQLRLEEEEKRAESDISELEKKLDKATTGFESVDAILEFLLAIQEILQRLNDQQIHLTSINGDLQEARISLKKLEGSTDFGDVDSAQAKVEQLMPAFEKASELLAIASDALARSNNLLKDLEEALAIRESALADSKTVLELDGVLYYGRNPAKQTLDTFVLQNMFAEVVHAANSHFTKLLEGRYELRLRDDENTKGNAQAGLDLEILDLKTQKARAPRSLSGGEVFCASLSLALGLSDVVLSSNGGIRIETFFIDEGFGSLDGERLNQVMEMLNVIRNTGRTVCVISHVEDMKQAIYDRIEVRPIGNAGASTLSVSWAN